MYEIRDEEEAACMALFCSASCRDTLPHEMDGLKQQIQEVLRQGKSTCSGIQLRYPHTQPMEHTKH